MKNPFEGPPIGGQPPKIETPPETLPNNEETTEQLEEKKDRIEEKIEKIDSALSEKRGMTDEEKLEFYARPLRKRGFPEYFINKLKGGEITEEELKSFTEGFMKGGLMTKKEVEDFIRGFKIGKLMTEEKLESFTKEIRGDKLIEDNPKEEIGQSEEKKDRIEEKIEKIDEVFNELVDVVKHAPEVEQEVLKVLVDQIKHDAKQMKDVRSMKHFHEMKELMAKHWKKLNEQVKGDPVLLEKIQNWGKKFAEEKVVYYETIENVKDELIEKSKDIQNEWNDIQISIGKVKGLIGSEIKTSRLEKKYFKAGVMPFLLALDERDRKTKKEQQEDEEGVLNEFASGGKGGTRFGIEKFITSLNDQIRGFDANDIDVASANIFLEKFNGYLRGLTELAYSTEYSFDGAPIGKHPELAGLLEEISDGSKRISDNIKEASKIYKVTKKIQDTHFLKVYNE